MQENAVSERFCLGCGVSVVSLKNYEKRLLCGEVSRKMLANSRRQCHSRTEAFVRKLHELDDVCNRIGSHKIMASGDA